MRDFDSIYITILSKNTSLFIHTLSGFGFVTTIQPEAPTFI